MHARRVFAAGLAKKRERGVHVSPLPPAAAAPFVLVSAAINSFNGNPLNSSTFRSSKVFIYQRILWKWRSTTIRNKRFSFSIIIRLWKMSSPSTVSQSFPRNLFPSDFQSSKSVCILFEISYASLIIEIYKNRDFTYPKIETLMSKCIKISLRNACCITVTISIKYDHIYEWR